MGYQMLRLACPERVPSILLLEAPAVGSTARMPAAVAMEGA
jgi:hypothetical protein